MAHVLQWLKTFGGDIVSDFKTGDRVKVEADGRTGEIVAKGGPPTTAKMGNVVQGKEIEPEISICRWKVRLDETGEEKDFRDDELEKLL